MKKSILRLCLTSLCFAGLLTGCTWVELDEQGYAVTVINQGQSERCEKIGTASSNVLDNLGPISRNEERIQDELIRLAKNEAGEMGGNAILPLGTPVDGAQSFDVYHCES